jgi:predicted nucleotidyltransferase component of viral defense system
MPDKSYYNRLYAFPDEIMKIIQRQGVHFYLTGGTALSRCYLNHRYSDDPDFFINQAPECVNVF